MAKSLSLPEKYRVLLPEITKLVAKTGVKKNVVWQKMELPEHFFSNYTVAAKAYDQGMAKFKLSLMKRVMDTMDTDSQSKKYLMEKTQIFESEVILPHPKPKDSKEALENLSHCVNEFALNRISDKKLQSIRSAVDSYSTLHIHTELQERIESIEKLLKDR